MSVSKQFNQHVSFVQSTPQQPGHNVSCFFVSPTFYYVLIYGTYTEGDVSIMKELSVNKFRANIKSVVDEAISEHEPVKVKRRAGRDFVVVSAEDWDREQETLYIMQNENLMKQIADSVLTHTSNTGYTPSQEELDEINSI